MRHHRIASLLVSLLVFPTFPALTVRAYSQNTSQQDPGSVSNPPSPGPAAAQNPTSSAEPNTSSGQDKSASASEQKSSPVPQERMSKQTRLEIIRDFETQIVYARTMFPIGAKGLRLKDGVITPGREELQQQMALFGPAVKVGDPAHISYVQVKDDHIRFEINGGPVHRKKWYQHIEIQGAHGGGPIGPSNDPQNNPHGSFVDLCFDHHVPELTAQQVRELLAPVLDFHAKSKQEAYLDTVPPKVKEAIQNHRVLVGMNQEMVVYAKGKAPKKVRERDGETEYEEWIYGEPPQDVDFVRFTGDEVVRVETMKVGGEKIVRTEKEVVLDQPDKQAKEQQQERPSNAPSLRRPGEDSEDVPRPANGPANTRPAPPMSDPSPPGNPGPGEIRPSGR
jgi:hypothetical protein